MLKAKKGRFSQILFTFGRSQLPGLSFVLFSKTIKKNQPITNPLTFSSSFFFFASLFYSFNAVKIINKL
jgi:hypothetical protein